MTKSELIENLIEHHRLSKKSESWFKAWLVIFCALFIVVTSIFDSFDNILFNIGRWAAAIIFILLIIHGNRAEKNIDRETSMFCKNCKKRYNEETLAYAVLVNECQNCESSIYET